MLVQTNGESWDVRAWRVPKLRYLSLVWQIRTLDPQLISGLDNITHNLIFFELFAQLTPGATRLSMTTLPRLEEFSTANPGMLDFNRPQGVHPHPLRHIQFLIHRLPRMDKVATLWEDARSCAGLNVHFASESWPSEPASNGVGILKDINELGITLYDGAGKSLAETCSEIGAKPRE